MTVEQVIDLLFDEANQQGEPLSRDVCQHMARRLMQIPDRYPPPGEVAQKFRQRYDSGL